MAASKKTDQPKDLMWQRENGWNRIKAGDKRAMAAYCRDYLAFISECKTEREAHNRACMMAREAGYVDLEGVKTLKPGDRVLRSFRGKTLLLAQIGRKPLPDGLRILGGHVDAPRLDLKPNPVYEDSELVLLDTHYYGGIKKYQWVTLPLALHGVAMLQNGTAVQIVIGEDKEDPVFVVTDLLPHLGKDQAKKNMNEGIPGENLNILFGSVPVKKKDVKEKVKQNILSKLYAEYGIKEEDFASAELEVVPAGPGRDLGFDRSLMLSYAHDDRICAYAALRAELDKAGVPDRTSVLLLCDKEEIGSVGATGMESTFFENTVAEILSRTETSYNDLLLRRCLEKSQMISADVNAAHDPNYPDVSAPNNNMGQINHGVMVTKYTGARGKSHASEATAEFMSVIRRIFNDAGVAWQTGELGKVDQGGGGTIAMFLARYGMDVVDAGPAILSMHAPWEAAAKLDAYMTYKGYKAFLEHRHA